MHQQTVTRWIEDFTQNGESAKTGKIFNFQDDEWLGIGDKPGCRGSFVGLVGAAGGRHRRYILRTELQG
jgi:hypothetical protein